MPTDLPSDYQYQPSVPPPPPSPPRRGVNNCLVASMAGCGLLLIVFVIVASIGIKNSLF